jgi:antitoxin component HigA of HigAB toxin-antitoxin module
MVFDAGRVVFYGDADLSAVETAVSKIDGYAKDVDTAFQSIKPLEPTVDVSEVVSGLGEIQTALTKTFSEATVISPELNAEPIESAAETAAQVIGDKLAGIPPVALTVDTQALDAAAAAITSLTLDVPPIRPALDDAALIEEASQAAAALSDRLTLPPLPLELAAGDLTAQADALASTLTESLTLPPVTPTLEASDIEQGALNAVGVMDAAFKDLPPVVPTFSDEGLATETADAVDKMSVALERLPPVELTVDLNKLAEGTEAGVALADAILQRIQPAEIEVDKTAALSEAAAAVTEINALFGDIEPVDEVIDPEAAGAQAEQVVSEVDAKLQEVSPVRPHVEAQQAVSDAANVVNQVNAETRKVQPITIKPPGPDAGAESVSRAKQIAAEVADALSHITEGKVSLNIAQLETAAADAQKIFGSLTAGFSETAAAALVFQAAVVAAALAAVEGLRRMGEEWVNVLGRVSAQTGKTGEDLEKLASSMVRVSQVGSAAGPAAIAEALVPLSQRLNLTGKELEDLTTQVLKFAKVAGVDGATAAKELSQAFTQFHEPATNYAKDIDTIVKASQLTGTPIAQLEDQLKGRLAPTLSAIGFTLQEATILLARMGQGGDQGRLAIQAFNKVLQEASASGRPAMEVWRDLKVELEQSGESGSRSARILREELGPSYVYLSSLAKAHKLDTEADTAAMERAGLGAAASAKEMQTGAEALAGSLTKATNLFAPLATAVIDSFDRMEKGFAGAIDGMVRKLSDFEQKYAALQKALPGLPTGGDLAAGVGLVIAGGPVAGPLLAANQIMASAQARAAAAAAAREGGDTGPGPDPADVKLKIEALKDLEAEIKRLNDAIEHAGGDTVLVANLELTKTAAENAKTSLAALPPDLRAVYEIQISAAAAADEHSEALRKAADELNNYASETGRAAKGGQDLADAQVRSKQAAVEFAEAQLKEVQATQGQIGYVDRLDTALRNLATAHAALEKANAAQAAAQKATDEALKAGGSAAEALTAFNESLARSSGQAAGAIAATNHAAAAYAATQALLNPLVAAFSPYMDAAATTALKLAQQTGSTDAVLKVLAETFGLTAEQMEKLKAGLGSTPDEMKKVAEAAKALAQGVEGIFKEDQEARAKRIFGAITDTLPPAIQAAAQFDARVNGVGVALDHLGEQGVVSGDKIGAAMHANTADAARLEAQLVATARGQDALFQDDVRARADAFFGTVSSGMDTATKAHFDYIRATEGSQAALEAMGAAGIVSAEDVTKALNGTKAQLDEVSAHAQAAAKGFEGFLKGEQESNAKKVFDDLTVGMNAAELAQAKLTAGTQGFTAAVEQMGSSSPQQFALVEAAINGDTAALKALELQAQHTKDALNAAATYKATGIIPPAPAEQADATKNYHEAVQKIDEAASEQAEKFATSMADLKAEYAKTVIDFEERGQAAADALGQAQVNATAAREDSAAQLAADLSKAQSAFAEAQAKYDKGVKEANRTYNEHVTEAAQNLGDSIGEINKTFTDAMAQIDKAEQAALDQNTKAHQAAFKAQSDAMEAFNQQQIAQANALSIAQENARVQSYGFTDPQSVASAKRAAEIQQAGTAALQQAASASALNKAMAAAQKQAADADEAYGKQVQSLEEQREKARKKHDEDITKARDKYEKAITKAEEERSKKLTELGDELSKAARKLHEAQAKAYDDAAKREKKIKEDLAKAQAKYDKDMKKLDEDKAKAAEKYQRHIDDLRKEDAKQRRKFETDREKAYRDFNRAWSLVVEGLRQPIEAMHTTVKEGVQKWGTTQHFAMNNLNVQETNVSFLNFAVSELDKAMAG